MINKRKILKFVDSLIGDLLVRCFPVARRATLCGTLSRILVIRPGGIGDAVLLIPALLAIKERYPDTVIDVLAEKRNAAVLTLCPVVNRIFSYDKCTDLAYVLTSRYDAVIDTEQWYRLSATVARSIRSPLTIGFATNKRARLFSHPVPYMQSEHETAGFYRLLAPLRVSTPAPASRPVLHLPEEATSAAAAILKDFEDNGYVVIFPGASVAEKVWSAKNFSCLVSTLQGRGFNAVVVGGANELSDAARIAASTGCTNLAGRTNLAETAAILANAKIVITSDSGLLHVAAGLGVRTVSLFGPTSVEKWAPKGVDHTAISKRLPCSPCGRFGTIPGCQHNVRCMKDISVEEVGEAVLTLLARIKRRGSDKNA